MKFYEKYPQLQQKQFLAKLLTETIFSTMSLENQQVAKSHVAKIVQNILKNEESKGGQFFTDQ